MLFVAVPARTAAQVPAWGPVRPSGAVSRLVSSPTVRAPERVSMQLPRRRGRLSRAQKLALGLGATVGAVSGLVLAFATAPDDCGLECLARPAGYVLVGTGIGLTVGLGVAIALDAGAEGPTRVSAALRVPIP